MVTHHQRCSAYITSTGRHNGRPISRRQLAVDRTSKPRNISEHCAIVSHIFRVNWQFTIWLLKYIALFSQQCENKRKVICRKRAFLLDALLLNDRKQPKMRTPTQLIVRDAVDRKRYYVQHSVMRATKTTQQTTHFLSGPCLSNVNIAMHESFSKSHLERVVLTVRLFCRHCLQHPSR